MAKIKRRLVKQNVLENTFTIYNLLILRATFRRFKILNLNHDIHKLWYFQMQFLLAIYRIEKREMFSSGARNHTF